MNKALLWSEGPITPNELAIAAVLPFANKRESLRRLNCSGVSCAKRAAALALVLLFDAAVAEVGEAAVPSRLKKPPRGPK